jgi:hypothetical protein
MADESDDSLQKTLQLLREARERAAGEGSFRTRVLLDMVLIELEKAVDGSSDDDRS